MAQIEIFGHVSDPKEVLNPRRTEQNFEDGTKTVLFWGVNTSADQVEWETTEGVKGIYEFAENKGFEIKALTLVETD